VVATLDNLADQALDIAGSITHVTGLTLTDESAQLGVPLTGQSGSAASITVGVTVVVSGLAGMTAQSPGNFLTISGAATPANNGTFLIVTYNSATSVDISNGSAATDLNNGAISWIERRPYTLENDLNYVRTDRENIKGVGYDDPVPQYFRCDDQSTPIDASLANLAGNTTDAKSVVTNRLFNDASVVVGDGYVTITSVGALKHADAIDLTGVPINDGYDAGNDDATYADVIADGYEAGLTVLSGPNIGNRIFGRARAGTTGTSPDSVEVEFRSVVPGALISTSIAYTWEAGQPTTLDLYYGYRNCLSSMPETALRTMMVNGLVADASLSRDLRDIRQTIGTNAGDTDLAGELTNLGSYFPFNNLPDVTPSVVEALNTLNEQVGDRDYTGIILTDGYTITQSLQELADAITAGGDTVTRTIERLTSSVSAGTAHTLPGGLSYVIDPANNGRNMWVFYRKQLRSPGPISGGNDYDETSTTSITPYKKINNGDHIHYFIRT
jgi:hypothetical protein